MPGQTKFVNIDTCRNQKDSFVLQFTPPTGTDLTGCVVSCRVLQDANAVVPLMTPSVTTVMVGNTLEATFSWTQAQSALLPADGARFSQISFFPIEVDVAFPDDPTEEAMRFVSNLAVSPGGNALGS